MDDRTAVAQFIARWVTRQYGASAQVATITAQHTCTLPCGAVVTSWLAAVTLPSGRQVTVHIRQTPDGILDAWK